MVGLFATAIPPSPAGRSLGVFGVASTDLPLHSDSGPGR
jgi:hypothetical protein